MYHILYSDLQCSRAMVHLLLKGKQLLISHTYIHMYIHVYVLFLASSPIPSSLPTSRSGRKAESSGRVGVVVSGELGGAGQEDQLDGCGYIMASSTVFLRLIEVYTSQRCTHVDTSEAGRGKSD